MTSFEHPALAAAAARLTALQAAAVIVGAPDPVAALQHMDCSPEAIRASSAQVSLGALALVDARTEFRDGIERAWAPPAFGPQADRVDVQYAAAIASATATASAGQRIADHVDALAAATAAEVTTLAADVDADVTAVLDGDRSFPVVAAVATACRAVVAAVATHVESITDIAPTLDATRPRVADPGTA